jgi:hypothetical protein
VDRPLVLYHSFNPADGSQHPKEQQKADETTFTGKGPHLPATNSGKDLQVFTQTETFTHFFVTPP